MNRESLRNNVHNEATEHYKYAEPTTSWQRQVLPLQLPSCDKKITCSFVKWVGGGEVTSGVYLPYEVWHTNTAIIHEEVS